MLILKCCGSIVMAGLCWVLVCASTWASYADREDVRAYIAELTAEHELDPAELEQLFAQAEHKQSIIDAISRPAERVLNWAEYRKIFIEEDRITQGLAFWRDNAVALERAELRFGVAPEFIVAIIGVETRYGRISGSYRVLDALSTLAFDYPPRAPFFRGELTHYLLMTREEGVDPLSIKGSYAGAMGFGQFIPSSFRTYAVDFDADGRRDIWTNKTDAIGSVANYFARHGWQRGQPVVIRIDPLEVARQFANESLELDFTVAALRDGGIDLRDADASNAAEVFVLDGAMGTEYRVALPNFYVITRYNRSRMYALAVTELAQEIRSRRLAGQARN